jgi:hypothetical protein
MILGPSCLIMLCRRIHPPLSLSAGMVNWKWLQVNEAHFHCIDVE